MSDEADVRASTRAETRQSLLLWFGIFAAPLAWTVQIFVAPDLNEVLCLPGADGSGRGTVFGMDVEIFLVGLSAAAALIAVLGGVSAYSCLRRLRSGGDETPGARASWMASAGVFVSLLFLLAIVVGFVPMIFLEACEVSI